ncbi:MAG: class I SAM-dependent methyltransferase [Bryobacteraceae bacterium]|nr:class I SAM-dependent methyltransferase [Bryobacteraceae bacterium]
MHVNRFSGRAADYLRGRPSYPEAVVDELERQGLLPGSLVVDVGAGTGLASLLFLRRGYRVIAIEPNAEMRAAAAAAGIDARPGTGEDTGLPAACADLVLAAQSFHWMDQPRAWAEFERIARPGALIALLWNNRVRSGSPFLEELEALLHRYAVEDIAWAERMEKRRWPGMQEARFPNSQSVDFDGLLARIASMSWMPRSGTPAHAAMAAELRALFDRRQQGGLVELPHECVLYWTRRA